jgi:localization factor PodJL
MPNPAQSEPPPQARARPQVQNPVTPAHFEAAPREFAATALSHEPAPSFMPKAISDILDPRQNSARQASLPSTERVAVRPPITTELPPDFPLEPGTRPHVRVASPSERIAASEEAISELSAGAPEQASASGFIAAARRAAQAAANGAGDKSRAAKPAPKAKAGDKPADKAPSISSKIRSLLVGASVVVIVLGSFKVAMTVLDAPSSAPFLQQSGDTSTLLAPDSDETETAPAPAPVMPSMTSPTPIGRQSMAPPVPQAAPIPFIPEAPPLPTINLSQNTAAAASAAGDITGSITAPQPPILPPSNRKIGLVSIPAAERLPDAIGGVALRSAALKGDASAAYEVGVRYAEGKGVPSNYDEAAKWYERAAQAGVVPAMFRLGTLYEKGLSVKRDLDVARRYYTLAAERGNAKAMHNLAVLDADGGGKGANYKSASLWFRKAADRGVADSQFNLGILYARGIGVDQNLAESFKWFSLAAAQGDTDAGRKRDDIGKRLDPQSLAAAKLAIQTFAPEGQPEDAINVATPVGGWDAAPQATAKALGKRASR